MTDPFVLGGALVGYSGFVGSNLAAAREFSGLYNSSNVDEMAGRHFDTVVFSAARAEKWRINQDPESDLVHIAELERILSSFRTERLVLISTVDVYAHPDGVDEDTEIELEGLHPYGAHRYRLEQFAREQHGQVHVVRLPGLFGPGIKKNVVFDLLHDNNVDRINPDVEIQYYDLARLADDIETVVRAELGLVNMATPPLRSSELARELFGVELAPTGQGPVRYDMHTRHADAFGGSAPYVFSDEEVWRRLRSFVAAERAAEVGS
jgi:hypothetical protein